MNRALLLLILCMLSGCGQKSPAASGHAGKHGTADEVPDESSTEDKGFSDHCGGGGAWTGQYQALVGRAHAQTLAISQDRCRSISFSLEGVDGKRKYGWKVRLLDWEDDLKWVSSGDPESQTLDRVRRAEDQTLIHERCQRVGQECAFLVFSERYRMLSDGSILYEGVWPEPLQLRFLRTEIQ